MSDLFEIYLLHSFIHSVCDFHFYGEIYICILCIGKSKVVNSAIFISFSFFFLYHCWLIEKASFDYIFYRKMPFIRSILLFWFYFLFTPETTSKQWLKKNHNVTGMWLATNQAMSLSYVHHKVCTFSFNFKYHQMFTYGKFDFGFFLLFLFLERKRELNRIGDLIDELIVNKLSRISGRVNIDAQPKVHSIWN